MKITYSIIISSIIVTVFILGCTGRTPLYLTQIATKQSATAGQMDVIFRVKTDVKQPNGQYITFLIKSIIKHDKYDIENQTLANAIVIETVTPKTAIVQYFDEAAYFNLYDICGNEITVDKMWAHRGKKGSEMIITSNSLDFKKIKYIRLSGIDEISNDGKTAIMFGVN